MQDEEKAKDTVLLFLQNFKEKDLYTQIVLEMIFEELSKNEKK